jgi:hypothetical protein
VVSSRSREAIFAYGYYNCRIRSHTAKVVVERARQGPPTVPSFDLLALPLTHLRLNVLRSPRRRTFRGWVAVNRCFRRCTQGQCALPASGAGGASISDFNQPVRQQRGPWGTVPRTWPARAHCSVKNMVPLSARIDRMLSSPNWREK